MHRNSLLAAAAAAALAAAACAPTQESRDDTSAADMSASADAGASTAPPASADMSADRTIVENAAASQDFETLVAAVRAAGLDSTLSGQGPFTVFAPTDAAFEKLPAGTVDALLQPANKNVLTAVLAYHVVPGRVTAADLTRQIEAGGGKATLATVQGAQLTATNGPDGVTVTDTQGNASRVTAADRTQKNGVIHVVDAVLLPAALTPRAPAAGAP
jgi:uncharacterized surface protein with fasciclin (FAS1) repeats